jgi:clan AA aspartic protease (TIGR02281 family)
MQSVIYREWLKRLIAEGNEVAARAVYDEAIERFPQDPAIHLAGVELVLQRRNWRLAERILAARRYPPDLRDWVNRLEQGINDLKSEEGKILIRFQPGSRAVPVSAVLDGTVTQPFLIDTGASVVTIPSETAHRLGIDLTGRLPRRLFYSATGAQNAIEVTLPSIEIGGREVVDVKALVVDLPGQPGVGLLGMNYLRNFRMDIDTDQGLLTLVPQ